ncbi:MAG: helix-turn-helix transcriptional regulator [Lachnospiraceae bacterium]|nr:helix-turn-helix transcriptional regulator [Lachnospiraceae bacterium]
MQYLIWQMRIKNGVTLVELSRRTGISKSALNNYENGKRSPTLVQVEVIARALECRITELFYSDIL